MCIIFEEEKSRDEKQSLKSGAEKYHKLGDNKFVGFKRLVFSDKFIDEIVKPVWEDTRNKVLTGTLVDVLQYKKEGSVTINKSGDVSSAPNFIKSKDNGVFLRGAGINSSLKYKTECVNGIKMLPQYIWIKGTTIVDALKEIALL